MGETVQGWTNGPHAFTRSKKDIRQVESGRIIGGKYHILDSLGQGGMGSVYLAERLVEGTFQINPDTKKLLNPHGDYDTDGLVAVKSLNKPEDLEMRIAFEEESRRSLGLQHSNIIPTLDRVRENGYPYLIMAHIPGYDLAQFLEKGFGMYHGEDTDQLVNSLKNTKRRPPEQVVAFIALNIIKGLQYALETQELIHRDISLGNVMLRRDQAFPIILDFGVSKTQAQLRDKEGAKIAGNPDFMAPETVTDPHSVDFRADMYSVGAVMQYLLHGFSQNSMLRDVELSEQFAINFGFEDEVKMPHEIDLGIDPELSRVIHKATMFRPEDRYESYAEFRDDLARSAIYTGNTITGKLHKNGVLEMSDKSGHVIIQPNTNGKSNLVRNNYGAFRISRNEDGSTEFSIETDSFGITTDKLVPLLSYYQNRDNFNPNDPETIEMFERHLKFLQQPTILPQRSVTGEEAEGVPQIPYFPERTIKFSDEAKRAINERDNPYRTRK